ncbi:ribonuclease H-like domain-containing protein, partial [Tanacetum coccineum]
MTWHATGKYTEPGKMQHPVDGRAWKNFDTKYPYFAKEPINVRLGLTADGFIPFGNFSQAYSMWPMILTTYNLPPWLCMKESSFMLTLLIPGPKSSGKDIDVYFRPLIDGLKVIKTLHLCVLGKTAYVDHRRFLKKPHKWRRSLEFNGEIEDGDPPRKFNRNQIHAQLARLPTRVKGKHPSYGGVKIKRNSQQFQQFQTATISANNAKFPYLEKEKYEIWAMKMEYWIQNADHNLWRIVQQGNSPKRLGKDAKGNTIVHPPVSLDEHVAVQRENKVRTLLLQALPEDHMPDFHHYDDARDIWMAVKARFGGNEESKKMRKTMLKQQFTEFSVTEEEGLHKGYDRFQKILSQLNQVQARPDNDDINLKFLRALPSSWSQVALALKTRGGLDSMSFDDLYNKLRSLELDVRIGHSYGVKAAAPTHSAFIGAASSGSKLAYSDQQSFVPSVYQTSGRSDNIMECVLHSFVAENESDQDMIFEDFDQVDQLEMEELDLKWQMAMLSLRINRFEKKAGRKMNYNNKQPARFDRRKVRCYKCLQLGHFARECNVKTVDDKARYSAFKVTEVKTDEPKALVSVDSMVNWSDHAAENKTGEVEKIYGMMAGLHVDNGGADVSDATAEFAMMGYLGTKDETFYVLKEFIALILLVDLFFQFSYSTLLPCLNKNAKLIELCGEKGIKRDYSNPRTPQQ